IDIMGPTPLTDEELENFSKLKPLSDIYVNVYKRSDFLLALEGLKRFDEEADDYNIFSYEAWQDKVEELSALYPEEEEEVEEEEEPQSKITIPKQVTTAPKTTTTPKGESLKAESPKSVKTMNLD